MSRQTTNRLALGLLVSAGTTMAARVAIGWSNKPVGEALLDTLVLGSLLAWPVVGAIIARRQPSNAIGWIFLTAAVVLGAAGMLQEYARYSLINNPGALPGGALAEAVAEATLPTVSLLAVVALLSLFPDGRALSHRWAAVLWCAVPGAVGLAMSFVLATTFSGLPNYRNPYAAQGTLATGVGFTSEVSIVVLLGCLALSALSAVLRFRRGSVVERQQLKWIGVAAVGNLVAWIVFIPVAGEESLTANLLLTLTILAMAAIPLAAGIAILRYRLYEIDILIRKTLVYAALIAVLAAVYLGGVSLLGWLSRSVIGQSGALAVTLSTLVVAAAFQPLRHRLQRAIDRRFYRRRYDATQTLIRFNHRMREQIDLDALQSEVLGVVSETLQPSSATLWLRRSGGAGNRGDARAHTAEATSTTR